MRIILQNRAVSISTDHEYSSNFSLFFCFKRIYFQKKYIKRKTESGLIMTIKTDVTNAQKSAYRNADFSQAGYGKIKSISTLPNRDLP